MQQMVIRISVKIGNFREYGVENMIRHALLPNYAKYYRMHIIMRVNLRKSAVAK